MADISLDIGGDLSPQKEQSFAANLRVTSPLLLLAVAASAGAGYLLTLQNRKGSKVVLLGRELPLGQQYGLVALCSLPVFYWAGAGAALFWVLGASFFVIGLHAAFYNIDNLLYPENEQFGLEQV